MAGKTLAMPPGRVLPQERARPRRAQQPVAGRRRDLAPVRLSPTRDCWPGARRLEHWGLLELARQPQAPQQQVAQQPPPVQPQGPPQAPPQPWAQRRQSRLSAG